ncbi:DUF2203 family protein [Bdellovibrionales bacterium]|nr:DUF2203 family protein [Bdellovibrionales bacterium]
MLESDVVDISRHGIFCKKDADQVLLVLSGITAKYSCAVEALITRLETLNSDQTELIKELEGEINSYIKSWHIKVRKLGGEPKGLWLIDFDCGDGYFCWQYPEPEVLFWHGYQDGFSKRISLSERPLSEKLSVEKPSDEKSSDVTALAFSEEQDLSSQL